MLFINKHNTFWDITVFSKFDWNEIRIFSYISISLHRPLFCLKYRYM